MFLSGFGLNWLLQVFYLRRRLFELESRVRRNREELDSERFAHGRSAAELRAKISELELLGQKYRKSDEALSEAKSALIEIGNAKKLIEDQLEGLVRERDAESANLQRLDNELQLARAELLRIGNALVISQNLKASLESNLEDLRGTMKERESCIELLQTERDDFQRRMADLVQNLDAFRIRVSTLEAQEREWTANHISLETELTSQKGRYETLSGETEAIRVENASLQRQLISHRTEIATLEIRLKSRNSEVVGLTTQLGEVEEKFREISQRELQIKANLEASVQTRRSLERELLLAEEEIQLSRERFREIEAELRIASESLAALQGTDGGAPEVVVRAEAHVRKTESQILMGGDGKLGSGFPSGNDFVEPSPDMSWPAESEMQPKPKSESVHADVQVSASAGHPESSEQASIVSPGEEPIQFTKLDLDSDKVAEHDTSTVARVQDVRGVNSSIQEPLHEGGIGREVPPGILKTAEIPLEPSMESDVVIQREVADTLKEGNSIQGGEGSSAAHHTVVTEQVRDDLTVLEGLTGAIAKRFEDAGIVSFQRLSKCSTLDIEAIVPGSPPEVLLHQYWIAEARRKVAEQNP